MATDFQIDWDRERRTGVPEAVYCAHKSPKQIEAILRAAREFDRRIFLTRLEERSFGALPSDVRTGLDYDCESQTAVQGGPIALKPSGIGLVCAGTSDIPIVVEACRTLGFQGHDAICIADVGVTGLWRLMERIDDIRRCRVVIAFAGMEGALFSVLAGLISAPVIAVPTSVGYGVAAEGRVALKAALASCAPGVVVVNIDNGFGAATAAMKILGVGQQSSEV
ncbi:nickel pincer cofactor biosynthesis protein LarB (plasmid) [Microvirga sp. RSM25]|uniref:nickel pincer cofactor biosynthesis protein LarB n=1 Tax=Microvirga sp. RSM25 TaxID=3273802 RepID=UPI00384AC851